MWNFEPTIVFGIGIAVALYVLCATEWRARFPGSAPVTPLQKTFFALAMSTAALALLSPIDDLSDNYLLMVHMIQHLLLTLIMPPLLLLSIPAWMLRPLLRLPLVLPVAKRLTNVFVVFALFNGIFVGWHQPVLYDGALRFEPLHIFQHVLFIATALLAWMPVLSPLPELPRLTYPVQVLYLFFSAIIPTVLGALITFAPDVLYDTYRNAPRIFNITALKDQQYAGLIMWLPGAFIYLGALTAVFFAWFEGNQQAEQVR